ILQKGFTVNQKKRCSQFPFPLGGQAHRFGGGFSAPQPLRALLPSAQNRCTQHSSAWDFLDSLPCCLHKSIQRRSTLRHEVSGIGENWPAAQSQESPPAPPDRVSPSSERARKNKYRIDASHLCIERNRLGAAGGQIKQGFPAAIRPGKGNRLDC